MSNWIRRTLVAMAATAVALLGLELWARGAWTAPWYERLIDEQAKNQKFEYTENSFGLRDRDYPTPKPKDRLRLLILGDSFTHGLGVPEDELVFPELLERELNAMTWPGKSGVDVLNGGIPGSLTQQWARLWAQIKDDFDPDALLLVFFLRDGTQLGSDGYFKDIVVEVNQPNQESPLYRHSRLYRMIRDMEVKRGFLSRYKGGFQKAYFGDERETRTWERAQKKLLELRDHAAERGAPTGLAVFPILVELNDDYPFQDVVDVVREFGTQNDIPTHDLLPDFVGHDAPDLWVSAVDQHPNAAGHAIAAESLLPFTVELLRSAADHSTR